MKIKRQKQAKKNINFYKHNFSFREPFQILIDGTFCQAALKNKIQIKEQMPKYLMGEVQLCTTNCALKELESMKDLYGAKLILQRYQVRNCKHFKNPVSVSECLLSMLEGTNPHHYFVATQDKEVTSGLKKILGVPLLYIILNTIVLDKPSLCSVNHVQAVALREMVTPAQQQSINSLKEVQGIGQDGERQGKKRKRKISNPNPLSCLKKKKKQPQLLKTEGKKKKRSRQRKRRKPEGGEGPSLKPTPNP
ncbi:rRNA-processing protein UTP23 homolog [Salmo salar]|uniref:rRNA-processing protein UTP23 homolog n=1 Tax=Salmo salar TaxID=8030 RepID=A0A1S3PZF3_SALSA|nr:rRNA-processing protein UTP23 homolog [Salmo salar]|eukprot:XP_014033090.1 PREDICTED: rRNA-processing protein UTP23 homolog [Salmo salar]